VHLENLSDLVRRRFYGGVARNTGENAHFSELRPRRQFGDLDVLVVGCFDKDVERFGYHKEQGVPSPFSLDDDRLSRVVV